MEGTSKIMQENIQLKQAPAIFMNRDLIKDLLLALKRVKSGNFTTEKEFFKNSPLKSF